MEKTKEEQSCDYYYNKYSHFSFHEEFLRDKIHVSAFRNAIIMNPSVFYGKVVLDVGCGTGILSLFAAKFGAKKVYSIEQSSISKYTKKIIEVNNLSHKIELLEGEIESIIIPEKVDLIISNWISDCLLYDTILPSVILARNRYLKPDGTIFPTKAFLYMSAMEDKKYYEERFGFYKSAYGFSFNSLLDLVFLEPYIDICFQKNVISDSYKIAEFDLRNCSLDDFNVNSEFSLKICRKETMHAFVMWFDVMFVGKQTTIEFSTSPFSKKTHWDQTIFYLKEPVNVEPGDVIKGVFRLSPNFSNPSNQKFEISFSVNGKEFETKYCFK